MIRMELFRFASKKHGEITLTRERWNHLTGRHPEMRERIEDLRETLEDPDLIEESRTDPESCVYYKKLDENYLVVPVHTGKHFVKTAYIATNAKGGKTLWTK